MKVKEIRVEKIKNTFGKFNYIISELKFFDLLWVPYQEEVTSEEELDEILNKIPDPKIVEKLYQ